MSRTIQMVGEESGRGFLHEAGASTDLPHQPVSHARHPFNCLLFTYCLFNPFLFLFFVKFFNLNHYGLVASTTTSENEASEPGHCADGLVQDLLLRTLVFKLCELIVVGQINAKESEGGHSDGCK